MKRHSDEIGELVRLALTSQVALGFDEVVISPLKEEVNIASPESVILNRERVTAVAEENIFENISTELPAAASKSIEAHYKNICKCELCPLSQSRNKFVYGVGNPEADILFVGEAPGAEEDRLGEPFVGRSGKLLDKILAAMELSRADVYIANIIKCRPPSNRDPQPAEMEKCFPHLVEQVRLIRPKVICGLGRIASQALLKTTTPLGKLRGEWHSYEGVPTMVTYHPAALLRFPQYKKDTWADMQMLLARFKGEEA